VIREMSPMPTRNVGLTLEQDFFIDDVLKTGEIPQLQQGGARGPVRALQQRRAGIVSEL
jgi:hypothetical protein